MYYILLRDNILLDGKNYFSKKKKRKRSGEIRFRYFQNTLHLTSL